MQHAHPDLVHGRPSPRAVVVGVGNADRGDDAVGLRVAEAVASDAPPDVSVHALRGDLTTLVDLMEGAGHLVVVDAMRTGGVAGTVRRLDLAAGTRLDPGAGFVSTHAFGLAEAMALGDALGRRPPRVTVIGIEASSFASGTMLSPAVAAAVPEAAGLVLAATTPGTPR